LINSSVVVLVAALTAAFIVRSRTGWKWLRRIKPLDADVRAVRDGLEQIARAAFPLEPKWRSCDESPLARQNRAENGSVRVL